MAVAAYCEPDANVIFGAFVDDAMGEEMRVTVIAAGFHQAGSADAAAADGPPHHRDRAVPCHRPIAPPTGEDDGDVDDMEIPDFLKG